MSERTWEFWIDVGGTFTDCIARRPDGSIVRHKLLSSGVTKGAVGEGSGGTRIVDRARLGAKTDFWKGYVLRLLDDAGHTVDERKVASFDAETATLVVDRPSAEIRPGRSYELTAGEESVVAGVRQMLALRLDEPIPPVAVRLGTTRGTNALLTRRGARTGFVTTRGFGDILAIGYQNRPRLFDLRVVKPQPLYEAVVEVDERATHEGVVLVAPDEARLRDDLSALRRRGITSLAVCLLHAYRFAEHEAVVERVAREVGFEEVSLSSRVAPLVKIVSRGDTTVVDAYLNPILRAYVRKLRETLGAGRLRVMTSAGGLVSAEQFVGKDSILSGPAGGVVGMARVAQAAGFARALGFDMGGTSTDVARFDGRFEMEYETEKAGVRIVAPMTAVHTVAAGGGSICGFDGVKLTVGPDSGGADPGPACYGRGGPLCVTDLNFFLGKIPAERFPFPLDRAAVERRLAELRAKIAAADPAAAARYDDIALCDGLLRVANANMVRAIQAVSVAKGYDPRDYVLVGFGGAAGQHNCAVARELGITQVLSHPDAGLLSAYGIGLADVVRHRAAGVYRPLAQLSGDEFEALFQGLADEARGEVVAEGFSDGQIETRRLVDLRYTGLDAFLTVDVDACLSGASPAAGGILQQVAAAYEAEHERLYGYRQSNKPIEVVAARIEAIGRTPHFDAPAGGVVARHPKARRTTAAWFDGRAHEAAVFDRLDLRPGDRFVGPAVICEASATTVVDPGWTAEMLPRGELLLRFDGAAAGFAATAADPAIAAVSTDVVSTVVDPVMLEIFNNQFAAIAEQMGITLRNTASSVNVKERLDFSCALFTATGELVVNAPHIPVHLGAMGQTVRAVLADNPSMRPGDVYVTNDPYRGGSHLPDITVVTPVFSPDGKTLWFLTASRAHHAEIGGIRPGSMPPFSKHLGEEGVLIRNFKLVDAGTSRADELRTLLTSAEYPSRSPDDNLADIAAQTAANHQGARDLLRLVERYAWPVVEAYMRHIRDAAERKMRSALARIPDGRYEFTDHLDDGTPIKAAVTIAGDSAEIDFTGTGPVSSGNLNANRAIVTAAVMYVLRCLIDEDIPLNEGVLKPVRITLPECLLNPTPAAQPKDCPAIVGGNVETSQRTVDVLLGALGMAAASQGTMNNTLFGDATFGYYETICGGNGATPTGPGADAVHTHMTNTRLTDPEVIELRYPVRVREFAVRRGSGGGGLHRGGDGIVRKIEFLRPLELSLVHQRRGPYAPYGLAGGKPGALGINRLIRTDGAVENLPGRTQLAVAAGEVLWLETPGGGGWGKNDGEPGK